LTHFQEEQDRKQDGPQGKQEEQEEVQNPHAPGG